MSLVDWSDASQKGTAIKKTFIGAPWTDLTEIVFPIWQLSVYLAYLNIM